MVVAGQMQVLSERSRPRRSHWERARHLGARNPGGAAGALVVVSIILIAIFAGVITDQSPTDPNPAIRLQSPSNEHPFGTDNLGRDLFSRTLFGTRISLTVGTGVSLVAVSVGIAFGLLAGYYRRWEAPVMRLMDAVMAFPGVILAIGIVAARGPSITNVIIALGFIQIPRVARLVRSVVLSVRERQFVDSARAVGAPDFYILVKHVLPNTWSPVIVQATFIFAQGVLGEATLSFLGVGPPPELPSWGNILGEARLHIREAPWLMLLPGIALTLTVFSLNLLGDAVRDILDPRLRRRA